MLLPVSSLPFLFLHTTILSSVPLLSYLLRLVPTPLALAADSGTPSLHLPRRPSKHWLLDPWPLTSHHLVTNIPPTSMNIMSAAILFPTTLLVMTSQAGLIKGAMSLSGKWETILLLSKLCHKAYFADTLGILLCATVWMIQ